MIAGMFRFFAGIGAKSRFEQALIRATYYGDESPPAESDIAILINTFQGNDEETRAQVAISSFFQRLEKGEERRQWIFVLKSLILMDRCVEERLMLQEIASYTNRYLEQFQGTSTQSSLLINRLIQLYFHHIKNKARLYVEKRYVFAFEKSERSARIDKLSVPGLFQEISECVAVQQSILLLNEMYKNGNKRLGVVQYLFDMLLMAILAAHSIQFRCVAALIKKAPSMDLQSLRQMRVEIDRIDRRSTKDIMLFLNSNKDMDGFKNIKYEELFRFGPKFLAPIDEMIKTFETTRNSRFSENYLVVPLQDVVDEQELESSGSLPMKKHFSKPNKHFTAGAARKTIHYTKQDDEDLFEKYPNGYSATFSAAPEPTPELGLRRVNSAVTSKIFDNLVVKIFEYSRLQEVKFEREVWNEWKNVYSKG